MVNTRTVNQIQEGSVCVDLRHAARIHVAGSCHPLILQFFFLRHRPARSYLNTITDVATYNSLLAQSSVLDISTVRRLRRLEYARSRRERSTKFPVGIGTCSLRDNQAVTYVQRRMG